MKVTVDDGRCRGHGVCITVCPEVFTLNDDGYAQARAGAIPAQYGSGPHGQHTVGRVVDARSESLAHPFDGRT
jgi:ferredoxin